MVSPKGRDRSFHFGTQEFKIVGMISHLGSKMGLQRELLFSFIESGRKCTLVYTGDGGASEGDFHEAVNTLLFGIYPVIIVVENNQWGLSTPSREQFRCKSFADMGNWLRNRSPFIQWK